MARMRTLKPETFTSEDMANLPLDVRWTFLGLWTYCDDSGRGRGDARLIKAAVWPLEENVTSSVVDNHVHQLEVAGLICRYVVAGKPFLHVVNFTKHQRPNRPVDSKLPACNRCLHEGHSEDTRSAHGGHTAVVVGVDGVVGVGVEGESADADVPPGTDVIPIRQDVERVCDYLAQRIELNGSKRPEVTEAWRTSARLLLDKDGRTEGQVITAIGWCQDDEFWRGNVLSMPTLRKQYDRLRLQASRGSEPKKSTTDQRVNDGLALAQKYAEEGR